MRIIYWYVLYRQEHINTLFITQTAQHIHIKKEKEKISKRQLKIYERFNNIYIYIYVNNNNERAIFKRNAVLTTVQ